MNTFLNEEKEMEEKNKIIKNEKITTELITENKNKSDNHKENEIVGKEEFKNNEIEKDLIIKSEEILIQLNDGNIQEIHEDRASREIVDEQIIKISDDKYSNVEVENNLNKDTSIPADIIKEISKLEEENIQNEIMDMIESKNALKSEENVYEIKQEILDEYDKNISNSNTQDELKKDESLKEEVKKDEPIKMEIKNEEPIKADFLKDEVIKEEVKKDKPIQEEVKKEELIKEEIKKVEPKKEEVKKQQIHVKLEIEEDDANNIQFSSGEDDD